MMVTMHSILRDRYSHRAVLLDATLFLSSIIIAALAFVDPDLLTWLPWSQDSSRVAIGIVAIVTFFISLVAARVAWKGKADAHGRAASAFSLVKFRMRMEDRELDAGEVQRMLSQYEEVALNAIEVPDSQFLQLKSEHYMKIRLSRLLDRFPATPIRFARLRLRLRHARRVWGQQ